MVEQMKEEHQKEVGKLQFVMELQTKKIKELKASGGEVVASTKGREKKRKRSKFGYRAKSTKIKAKAKGRGKGFG